MRAASNPRASIFGARGERLLTERRRPSLALNVLGLTVAVVGIGIAVSGMVDLIDGGPDVAALLLTGLVTWIVGSVLWRTTVVPSQIRVLDVFTTVTIAWVTIAAVGAIPYLVTGHFTRIDDALFEAMSGFTTTGATVTADIEATSKGLLFWRSMTQWMGGMGVIVLVVAVLPTVGSGGMSLLEAEAPGPTGERLTPRVRETARRLWAVYLGFTALMATAYFVAGMSLYDAVSHSFTTVSTGGFSPYQGSFGHFESATLEWICIVGMMLAGGSFTLYWRALRGNVKPLLRSTEFRVYLFMVGAMTLWAFITAGNGGSQSTGFRDALFTVSSTVTTTGYVATEYGLWSETAQSLLLIALPLGAMAGSTAGGIKILRIMAVSSFAHREALKHLHPKLVRPVRVGNAMLSDDVAGKVVGFLILALVIFGGGSFAIAATGPDLITSFSASATSLGNVGPGLGALDHTGDFLVIPREGRLIAIGQMLLGRLEIYPVILAISVVTLRLPKSMLPRRTKRS
ncbi:TrkH family potassium uptake protein [Ilumatobacter sp.]|uniref:TrkH family potassium uptake protein n=2 Tax=Ilumatobacter sp. TaxID=1967498 RepID=UPI002A32DBB7|nr:TrkH family potassium uptake protein [Ilumatobacter sp.]MDG1391145.1 TrkH family potassium uptake protein [Ilumatobacter sp.]MDG1785222.1 TrkH family potassium uptake protein [Ilumatobacter sp.]